MNRFKNKLYKIRSNLDEKYNSFLIPLDKFFVFVFISKFINWVKSHCPSRSRRKILLIKPSRIVYKL